jgi:hypothetical protein
MRILPSGAACCEVEHVTLDKLLANELSTSATEVV